MLKYFTLASLALFVGIASFLAEELFFPPTPPFKKGTIEFEISNDLTDLLEKKQLPPGFTDIRKVFISDHCQEKYDLNWSKLSELYFPQKSEGKFDLQIEMFDSDSDSDSDQVSNSEVSKKQLQLTLQMSLFDSISKNKVLEFSRSYKVARSKK